MKKADPEFMRTFLSAVAALAAVVLCLVAVPALWLNHHVVQEEGFIALAAPLGEDSQFRQSLADAAAETVLQEADFLPGLSQFVHPLVTGAAQSLTEDPQYPEAWTESLRRSHQLTFREAAETQEHGSGALQLDIAPLVSVVASNATETLGAEVPQPDQVLIDVGTARAQQNIELTVRYAELGVIFALAGGAALVLSLLAARRRSTTVALIGAGVLLAAVAWKFGADFAARQLIAGAEGSPVASLFAGSFVEAAQESFVIWVIAGAGAGAVLVLVGVIGRIFAGSQN